jgi:hypothetical protein
MKKTALNPTGTVSGRAGGWRRWTTLLPAIAMLLCFSGSASAEMPQRPKGTGKLMSVEANASVTIEGRGYNEDGSQVSVERRYLLSPHAVILDSQGKRTSLEKMELPTVIAFEYVFTQQGPEIRMIREMAQ